MVRKKSEIRISTVLTVRLLLMSTSFDRSNGNFDFLASWTMVSTSADLESVCS